MYARHGINYLMTPCKVKTSIPWVDLCESFWILGMPSIQNTRTKSFALSLHPIHYVNKTFAHLSWLRFVAILCIFFKKKKIFSKIRSKHKGSNQKIRSWKSVFWNASNFQKWQVNVKHSHHDITSQQLHIHETFTTFAKCIFNSFLDNQPPSEVLPKIGVDPESVNDHMFKFH